MVRTPEQILNELLVLKCQSGDPAALEALAAAWQRRLCRHAWQLTGERDAVSDIVQEAWLAIVRGLGRLDDPACFPAWAYRIVTHKCADWARRRQRDRKLQETAAREAAHRERSHGSDASANAGSAEDLAGALGRIPREQRVVLSLFYLEGLSIAEIAEGLDIPQGTVKSRLYHARNTLKQEMERSHERD